MSQFIYKKKENIIPTSFVRFLVLSAHYIYLLKDKVAVEQKKNNNH